MATSRLCVSVALAVPATHARAHPSALARLIARAPQISLEHREHRGGRALLCARCGRCCVRPSATSVHLLPPSATSVHLLPPSATFCHLLPPFATSAVQLRDGRGPSDPSAHSSSYSDTESVVRRVACRGGRPPAGTDAVASRCCLLSSRVAPSPFLLSRGKWAWRSSHTVARAFIRARSELV